MWICINPKCWMDIHVNNDIIIWTTICRNSNQTSFIILQAFNKCKREGFRLQTVDKAPLAKRRKMKKTSTSTETRSSSSESTHSSSSSYQSQEKTFQEGDPNPQHSNITPITTPVNTPVPHGADSGHQPAPPAFPFSEWQWGDSWFRQF